MNSRMKRQKRAGDSRTVNFAAGAPSTGVPSSTPSSAASKSMSSTVGMVLVVSAIARKSMDLHWCANEASPDMVRVHAESPTTQNVVWHKFDGHISLLMVSLSVWCLVPLHLGTAPLRLNVTHRELLIDKRKSQRKLEWTSRRSAPCCNISGRTRPPSMTLVGP